MPRNAAVVCKLAGLLIQARWYQLKANGERVPTELDQLLLNAWKGEQEYTEGIALSVLEYAAAAPKHMFGGFVREPNIFIKWQRLINFRKLLYRELLNQSQELDLYGLFTTLIESLPVLHSTTLEGSFFILPTGRVSAFPFIYQPSDWANSLFLYRFGGTGARPLFSFEDPFSNYIKNVRLLPGTTEFKQYRRMREVLGFKSVEPGMLYLFGTGYEDVRRLALLISNSPDDEAIRNGIHQRLFESCEPDVKELSLYQGALDRLIVLLAELGPYEVLHRILKNDWSAFEYYAKYIEMHIGTPAAQIREMCEREEKQRLQSGGGYDQLTPKLQRQIKESIKLETKCWAILRTLGMELDLGWGHAESISMRLESLRYLREAFLKGNGDIEGTGTKFYKLLERTFWFLLCFYSGLDAYHDSFQESEKDWQRHEQAMVKAAMEVCTSLERPTLGTLVNSFICLCKDASTKESVNTLLGRRRICDTEPFEQLALKIVNRCRHDIPRLKPLTKEEFGRFMDQTIELFQFLRDGREARGKVREDESQAVARRGRSDRRELAEIKNHYLHPNKLEPVYPLVVTFHQTRRKRGGLTIHGYVVEFFEGEEQEEEKAVNILTRRQYVTSEQYYCIPYGDRSVGKYWLEPFLVRCSQFDSIFFPPPEDTKTE